MNFRLKVAILSKYPSQYAFAKACGRNENWISRIIHERQKPTSEEKNLICEKLMMVQKNIFGDLNG